jgi:hypothetical protein
VHFFGKGCCEKCTGVKAAKKKEIEEDQLGVKVPIVFVKGNYFGTPLYTTCWINKGGDKERL